MKKHMKNHIFIDYFRRTRRYSSSVVSRAKPIKRSLYSISHVLKSKCGAYIGIDVSVAFEDAKITLCDDGEGYNFPVWKLKGAYMSKMRWEF